MLSHFHSQNCENFFSKMCVERMRSNESLHPRRQPSLREEDLKNFPFQVEGGRVLRHIACVKRLRRMWRKVEIIILAPPFQLSNYYYVFEVPVLMLIIFFK